MLSETESLYVSLDQNLVWHDVLTSSVLLILQRMGFQKEIFEMSVAALCINVLWELPTSSQVAFYAAGRFDPCKLL